MGNTGNTYTQMSNTLVTSLDDVDKSLWRFWEIEELPNVTKTSPAEKQYENIYHTTTTRQLDRRCVVHLPINCESLQLGQSRQMALQRFYRLIESRLEKSPELCQQYNAAMQDYLNSGHMNAIPTGSPECKQTYYTPRQAVIKPDNITILGFTQIYYIYTYTCTCFKINKKVRVAGNENNYIIVHNTVYCFECLPEWTLYHL